MKAVDDKVECRKMAKKSKHKTDTANLTKKKVTV